MKLQNLFAMLWADDSGSVIASEYLALASVVSLGTVAGLNSIKDSMNTEMAEFGKSVQTLSQSYSLSGIQACNASKSGSQVINTTFCPPNVTP